MNFDPRQFINPGFIEYDEKRHTTMTRFKEAVKRALFLSDDEKRNWTMLGYLLTNSQLEEVEQMIINEELRRFKTRQSLERIKPKPDKK